MTFSISEFSANINKYGTLKNNKYEVIFGAPNIMRSGVVGGGPDAPSRATEINLVQIMLRAEDVQIPGINLELATVNRYGIGLKQRFPTNITLPETISMTFIETEKSDMHHFFYEWLNEIFNIQFNGDSRGIYLTRYKEEYMTDIVILVYNEGDKELIIANKVILREAFPTQISEIRLGWADNNTLMKIKVNFTFSDIEISDANGLLGPGSEAGVSTPSSRLPR